MSNDIRNIQNAHLSNMTAFSLTPHGYVEDMAVTGKLFFQAAAQLPDGEFLGWQLSVGSEVRCSSFVFSSAEAAVTAEDFKWIFRDSAQLHPAPSESLDDFGKEPRKMYVLQLPSDSVEEDGQTSKRNYFNELLIEMGDANASLRILAQPCRRAVLLSLPDEISLRMRTLLSLAFPRAAVTSQGTAALQPVERIAHGMAGLLAATASRERWDDDPELIDLEEICDLDEDIEDCDEDCDEEYTLIEDLELSVRAYNCLKRAGINTIGQLCALNEEEIRNIRNLGKKNLEEIRRKLTALSLPGTPHFLTAPNDFSMLDELIGLQDVKEQVKKITAFARMKRDMARQERKTPSLALNMEFVGNPGTAKTTVARILSRIFQEIGILATDGLVEVGRADLVAKYVGHTADKVKSVFHRAKGKLLFIDEAYSLVDARSGDFGDEAITAIVQEMENHREDTIVIFAGYPDKMEEFFARNPGLRSRVPFQIRFQDYSAEEMAQIAELEAQKRGFTLQPDAKAKVAAICVEAAGQPDAGNGRFCRNLVENAILSYASRVYGGDDEVCGKDFALSDVDFSAPGILQKTKKTAPIGFQRGAA